MGEVVLAVSVGAILLVGLAFHVFGRRLIDQIAAREQSLAETNFHLDTAMATMANGLCLWDASERLVLSNKRACEILNLPPDKIVPGLTLREYLKLRHAAGTLGTASLQAVYEERLAVIYRREAVSLVDVTAAGRIVAILHRPVPGGGWIATYEDVTEQRAAERARVAAEADLLRQREQFAADASRAKSAFLAMMSHEIRTPMNAVLGLASSLLDGALRSEQREMVRAIHDSGDMLLRILNDILEFSKLDAGRITFEDAPFSPVAVTRSALGMLTQAATAKGLAITEECDAALPSALIGDAGRIRQILVNLISNAVKFTEAGAVTVRATCVARQARQATLRWSVSDTGIGVASDRIGSLFVEFVQADSSITRRFGGSGLGLAICKRLVTQMGGTISVASKLGEGATFHVELTLPVTEQPPDALVKVVDPAPAFRRMLRARGEPLRLLFAEDNPTNQLVVKLLLKEFDVVVDVVGNGREAVAAATRFAYDAIFMDMRMPEMDGLQATRAIREHGGRLGTIPIIAVTANAFKDDVNVCRDAGMNAFLPKPVNKGMLLNTLLQFLAEIPAAPPDEAPESGARDRAALAGMRDDIDPRAVTAMLASFEADTRTRLRTMAESLDDRAVLLREAQSLRDAAACVNALDFFDLMSVTELRLETGGTMSAIDIEDMATALTDYLDASRSFVDHA
jgi:signal transduction histidine kinase/CheY-like chemotaxis protein